MRNFTLEVKYGPEASSVSEIINPQMSQNQDAPGLLLRRSFSSFPQFGHRFDSIFCFHPISEYLQVNNYVMNHESIFRINIFVLWSNIYAKKESLYKDYRKFY